MTISTIARSLFGFYGFLSRLPGAHWKNPVKVGAFRLAQLFLGGKRIKDSAAVGVIGYAEGPTAIFTTTLRKGGRLRDMPRPDMGKLDVDLTVSDLAQAAKLCAAIVVCLTVLVSIFYQATRRRYR